MFVLCPFHAHYVEYGCVFGGRGDLGPSVSVYYSLVFIKHCDTEVESNQHLDTPLY